MQSTIRGELTRLLRTNSLVGILEQEVKFFRLKWTRRGHDGKEFDRIAKRYPWLAKKTLVGGPKKVKPKPHVYKIQHSKSLSFILFSKSHQQARENCTEIYGVVSASHLWLAQLLLTSSDACTVSRGRTQDERVRAECLSQFFVFLVVSKVRSRFAAPPCHQLSPASVRKICCSRINETRQEKNSIFVGCVSPAWFNECVLFLVESADQIRRASQRTDRFPVWGLSSFTQSRTSQ